MKKYEELIEIFDKESINYSSPGFYDNPQFLKLEAEDRDFLKNYAYYVMHKKYSQAYLLEAEKNINTVADVLFKEFRVTNQLGRCLDLSLVFGKILEKLGIWNFVAQGGWIAEFTQSLNICDSYLYLYDKISTSSENTKPGHAWLYAPPFKVIDLTLQYQKYSKEQKEGRKYLPSKVLIKDPVEYSPEIHELCHPEVLEFGSRSIVEKLKEEISDFSSYKVDLGEVTLKYIPCAMTASDGSLEKNTSIKFNGRLGIQIYDELIKPFISPIKASK